MRWALLCLLVGCERFSDPAAAMVFATAPREVEVIYSTNEDLTAIAFTIFAQLPESVGALEIETAEGYRPVAELATSIVSDREGIVVALLTRGRVDKPRFRVTITTPSRSYDVSPADVMFKTGKVAFDAAFTADDTAVLVTPRDPFAFALGAVTRAYDLSLRDPTCSDVLTTASGTRIAAPTLLRDDGVYCLRVTTGAFHEDVRLLTNPLFSRVTARYTPPPIHAPVVLFPVYDLELSDPDTCSAVRAKLTDLFNTQGIAVVSPLVISGETCRHPLEPDVTLADVQDRIGPYLATDPPYIVLVIWVSNVAPPVVAPLQQWAADFGARVDVAYIGLSDSPEALRNERWTHANDPELLVRAQSLLDAILPYSRYDHPSDTLVPFFPDGVDPAWFGFKLCSASRTIVPTVSFTPYATFDEDPLGFFFSLRTEFQPNFLFLPVEASADLEICTRFCALRQGFTWRTTSGCAP